MTAPLRQTIASFDTRLDARREDRVLEAITHRLAAPPVIAKPVALPALVLVGTAIVAVLALHQRSARVEDVAIPAVGVTEPGGSPAIAIRDRATAQLVVAHAITPDPPRLTADALYRTAEAALGRRDRPAARRYLERLLREFSTSPLIDAARYDLALIAIADRDRTRATALLDEVIATGREPNVIAAARRLRRSR